MSTAEPPPEPGNIWPGRVRALYELMTTRGLAEADRRGSAVDHLTARGTALLWLPDVHDLPARYGPHLRPGLTRFADDGAITRDLSGGLRPYACEPDYPYHSSATRLQRYVLARGPDVGPLAADFGATCDQIDRKDIRLLDPQAWNNDPGPLDLSEPDSQEYRPCEYEPGDEDYDPDRDDPGLRQRPTYMATLAVSPWFKERHPERSANLYDALRAGRSANRQANAEPDWEPEP